MRESDSFAYGPSRQREKKAARPPRVRSHPARLGRIASVLVPAPILLLFAMVAFAIAWPSLALIFGGRGLIRTLALSRSLLARLMRRAVDAGRATATSGRVVATRSAQGGRQRAPRVRSIARSRNLRRGTAAFAVTLSFLLLGGLVPVNAAVNDISTFAGRPDSGDGGAATSALVHLPNDVATDAAGNLFIADTYNHRIRRVSTTGTITTVAGNGTSGFSGDGGAATSAQLRFPEGVWVDTTGNLYIADSGNHRVRLVTTTGTISTIAGTGTAGFSGDGGPATAARLNDPKDITTDGSGNLYIADNENHRIRRVGGAGIITTVAGNGVEGYAGDGGPATSARLNDPTGVAFDTAAGVLYISDTENHRIRTVGPTGTIVTHIGTGTPGSDTGPPRHKAEVDSPERITFAFGGLLIADTGNDMIRFVSNSGGNLDIRAGTGTGGFSGDGGAATSAQLSNPTGVAAGTGGAFFIADSGNDRLRRVTSGGTISTYAGRNHDGGDGGAATGAGLNQPFGVATDGAGNVFIADWANHRVRRVSGGIITTVAGTGVAGTTGDGGAATSALLRDPADVAVDAAGNIYIADAGNHKIRRVSPGGVITTFAGTGLEGFAGDGGAAASAQLDTPYGLDIDAAGNLYIADTGNHRIRRVSAGGTITTVAGNGVGAFCGDGGSATSACIESPLDVAVTGAGNLYIADFGNNRVRSVLSGTIRTAAGTGFGGYSGDGGAATSASLSGPAGVEVDPAGGILISDSGNGRIRRVASSGTISTVGGNGAFGFAGDGGPAINGEMAFPLHIVLDPSGNLLIADLYNNRVRMIESLGTLPGPTMTGSTPPSPANDNAPLVYGTAAAGTTVKIYTTATCTGSIAATGTAAAFASPGLSVSVPSNSTTAFYATSTTGSGQVSACSATPTVYIEDSTAPTPPTITLSPASPGSDSTPSWAFTTDAGATTQCELSRGGIVLSPFAACTSPETYDLSTEPDDSYTFRVRATDAAGNTGNAASHTYVLDSTIPTAVDITSSPPSPSNDPSPSWSFTVEAGSSAECEFSYEGTVLQPFATCTSPAVYDLSLEPDGDYTFRVQARDGAGNPSAPVSSVYTYDTTDPAAPTIDAEPPSPGNSTLPSWSFSVEAGATAECELRRGGVVVSAWQSCASPASFELSGEPDGAYDFKVRAVDAAGNTGAEGSSTYTLDTTGPDVNITSSPSSPSSAPNVSWSFSSDPAAVLECELRDGANVVSPWGPCASPANYDLTGQGDGAYAFSARATDATGNTGDPASSVYVYDTTAPVVEITTGPAPVSSERNPEWSFTSEAGVTTECQLANSTGALSPFAPCTSPRSYDLTGQPDDTYTFSVRATDEAANLGPASASGYYLDSSGPASSITSAPASPDNDLSPTWGFSAEAGATTECELTSGATILSPYAPCTSPVSYDLTGQGDGPFTLSVRATDAAANVGAPASNTYILDTAAPAAPSITSSPASPGTLRTPSWTFTTELGATTECELSRGGTAVSGWSGCVSPRSYDLSGQPDGDYTFRVRATDGVGNTGPSQSSGYTLDTSGPTVVVSGPNSPGNGRTPSWTFTTEAGASLECQLSNAGGILQPFTPCGSPASYDLTGQPDGTYTVSVRATDAAGNTGSVSSAAYLLDTSGPVIAFSSTPASPGSDTGPSWAFTTEPGATTECELVRGPTVVQAFASCSSPATFDLAAGPDGDYSFSVRATDDADNTGPAATATYTLDTTPPAVPTITSAPASPGSSRSVTWSFSAEAGATTECELASGITILEAFGACSGSVTHSLTSRPDGEYTFRVRAADSLGNASGPATSTYTLDTTGPEVTITSEPSSPGDDRQPTWRFSAEAGASTECALMRGGSAVHPPKSCSSPASFDLGGEPDGTYTLRVRGTDPVGNRGAAATSSYELVTATSEPEEEADEPVAEAPVAPSEPSDPLAADPEEGATTLPERDGRRNGGDGRSEKGAEGSEEPAEVVPEPDAAREAASRSARAPGVLGEVFENVSTVVTGLLEQPAFPMILISLVVAFLVLQNRVDRRDPKLALAPVYPDPHLYFDPQADPKKGR